jgi:hypothetical protein
LALVFKHEAILTFVGRLVHDREFAEWFVTRPAEALASHGLSARDLRDTTEILTSSRHRPELSRALLPTVLLLLELSQSPPSSGTAELADRVERLTTEIHLTSERIAVARSEPRPWWKFWLW